MPDFDRNLDPIIKPKNLELEIGVNPALPDIQQGFGIDIGEVTTAGDDDGNRGGYSRLFTDLSAQSQKKAAAGRSDAPMLATYDVLKANSRWGIYNPNIQDPEEYKALGQSAADQWGNAFVKFGAFTLGTFAQSFNQIPKMLGLAGARGDNYVARLSGLDTYEEDIDNWYKNMEDWFPNYVTKWEREHPCQAASRKRSCKNESGNSPCTA